MDKITRKVEAATVPTGLFANTSRGMEGSCSTALVIEVEGQEMILASQHQNVRYTNYYVPTLTDSGAMELDREIAPDGWHSTEPLDERPDLNAAFLAVPSTLDDYEALSIEDVYTTDVKRGDTVRSIGWGIKELPLQLREGIVSTSPHEGRLYAQISFQSGASGAPVWTENGLIGCVQGAVLCREERLATPGEDPEEIGGRQNTGLSQVETLSAQIEVAKEIASNR